VRLGWASSVAVPTHAWGANRPKAGLDVLRCDDEPVVHRQESDLEVTLSRPTPADQTDFIAAVQASKALHHPWMDSPDTPERYARYLARADRQDCACFLVRHESCGGLVGFVNINNIIRGALQGGFLGYAAFASHAGRGLLTQGLRAVIAVAFGELGLHRLEADIQPGNTRSINMAKRLGFAREGLSPQYLMIDGAWRDHERWALRNDNWAGQAIAGG
jgi:[ribosomal protein S5]-alanine N-acetyltransferase